jgi:hypothetical protein
MRGWGLLIWFFVAGLVYLGATFVIEYWKSKQAERKKMGSGKL